MSSSVYTARFSSAGNDFVLYFCLGLVVVFGLRGGDQPALLVLFVLGASPSSFADCFDGGRIVCPGFRVPSPSASLLVTV